MQTQINDGDSEKQIEERRKAIEKAKLAPDSVKKTIIIIIIVIIKIKIVIFYFYFSLLF